MTVYCDDAKDTCCQEQKPLVQVGSLLAPSEAPNVARKRKLRVYQLEPNCVLGIYRYLPYVSGILRAYAETFVDIKSSYEFQPFLYEMEAVDNILTKIEQPDVLACSVSMWNSQLNLAVAKEVKRRYPNCLVIFGGCDVPNHPADFMREYQFIDLCVQAEGEDAFVDILHVMIGKSNPGSECYGSIPGVSWRDRDEVKQNVGVRPYQKDMDQYPSPYLGGYYDQLISKQSNYLRFNSLLETNRGCSFPCSFCVQKGALISTIEGPKKIEDVNTSDSVLGFDEDSGELVWNEIAFCKVVGTKPVVQVSAEGLVLKLTGDHKVLTKKGWKSADRMRIGDEVLCSLPKGYQRISPNQENVLQEVRLCNDVFEDEGRQSDEAEGCLQSSSRNFEEVVGNRQGRSVHVYGGREESDRRYRPQEADWGRQLHEAEGGSCESRDDNEGTAFSGDFCQNDGEQSYARSESSRPSCKLERRSSRMGEVQGSQIAFAGSTAESVRVERNAIFQGERSTVSVRRRRRMVDRALPVWEASKPGFFAYRQGYEEDNFSSWSVLAQQSKGREAGEIRLQGFRLGMLYHLGRRAIGQIVGEESSQVCWLTVESVEPAGTEEVYDLADAYPTYNFFANGILVHNCAWGRGGLTTKYRFHSVDRVKDEITWIGKKGRCEYTFLCDANWAMHPRDFELCEHFVKTKEETGFPMRVRACFGKNTDEKIFRAAALMHSADMEKGITLARQSNDPVTLKNIRRENIKLETYRNLQKRFAEKDVPVYIELILGLPGETVESWKRGIDDCLTDSAGPKCSLFVYLCQKLNNTELADPAYMEKFGIKTQRIELQEIHGSPRQEGWIKEFEDIVIETVSMPHANWREMCIFSWMTMLLHSMKAGFFVMGWLWDRFKIPPSELVQWLIDHPGDALGKELSIMRNLVDGMEKGEGRGQVLPSYGSIYFDVEEAALLRLSNNWFGFYEQLIDEVGWFLDEKNKTYNVDELIEVVDYQHARMPCISHDGTPEQFPFDFNIPEYFDKLFGPSPVVLEEKSQTLTLKPKDFSSDKEKLARETVLWGRKSGTMLVDCEWRNDLQ